MIKCSECGYENIDGLDYCDGCGAKLNAAAVPAGGEPTAGTAPTATQNTVDSAPTEPPPPGLPTNLRRSFQLSHAKWNVSSSVRKKRCSINPARRKRKRRSQFAPGQKSAATIRVHAAPGKNTRSVTA